MTNIFVLVSSLNLGDSSQAELVTRLFNLVHKKVNYIDAFLNTEVIFSIFDNKLKNINYEEKYIILVFGENGMNLIKLFQQENRIDYNYAYLVLFVHQFFSDIEYLRLNHLIIPTATINEKHGIDIVNKVPNLTYIFAPLGYNPSYTELEQSYNNMVNKPSLDQRYIVVMLPGDAPDNNNTIQYFTKDSAKKLYLCISKLIKDKGGAYKIIVENGPRTGRYDPNSKEVISKHEYIKGEDPSAAIDYISEYFLGLLDGDKFDYNFYNFAIEVNGDIKTINSYFNPLLFLAKQNQNIFILPGDSISLIGQIPHYLTSNNIIVFKSSSMNDDHQNVMQLAYERNYISYFDESMQVVLAQEISQNIEDDLSKVLNELADGYYNFNYCYLEA